MRFLAPSGLWLLFALPAILALYILKIRRDSRKVPSTWLWEKTLADLRADTPFQRLRGNLPLLLQLVAAGLLALAAARPVWRAAERTGSTVVLVLDGSASMNARGPGGTRFSRGRDALLGRLASAIGGDQAALIIAGRQPAIASPLTGDLDAVERALRNAEATDEEADMPAALRLARAIASRTPSAAIVVVTDDAASLRKPLEGGAPGVVVHGLESPAENAGIVAMHSRAAGALTQAFIAVENFGAEPRTVRLEIDLDGILLETRTLDLAPGGRHASTIDLPPSARGTLRARLDGKDALAADDQAWLNVRAERPIKVLLVTDGNVFLEKAWALERRVKLDRLAPGRYAGTRAEGYDLVAFDRWAPPKLPPANVLLFGVSAPELGIRLTSGATGAALIDEQDARHPLLAHADLGEVTVTRPLSAAVEPWVRVIARAEGSPVLFAGEREGRRFAATSFSPLSSDWPLRVSFPIFLANATIWLGQPPGQTDGGTLRPGRPLVFDAGFGATGQPIVVVAPGGRTTVLSSGAEAFLDARLVGRYRVSSGGREDIRFVSLLSERESRLWDPARATAPSANAARREASLRPGTPGLWRLLAAAVLLVLMLELAVTLKRGALT